MAIVVSKGTSPSLITIAFAQSSLAGVCAGVGEQMARTMTREGIDNDGKRWGQDILLLESWVERWLSNRIPRARIVFNYRDGTIRHKERLVGWDSLPPEKSSTTSQYPAGYHL